MSNQNFDGQGQQPYSGPPPYPVQAPGHPAMATPGGMAPAKQSASWRTVLAWVFSPIALLLVPIVFGGLAITFASLAVRRNEPSAKAALGVAIGCTVVSVVVGALVGASR